jgi:hypothetical protein
MHRVLCVVVPKWFESTDVLDKSFACFSGGNVLHHVEMVKKIADILG